MANLIRITRRRTDSSEHTRDSKGHHANRLRAIEPMEPRQLLTADPLYVGAVYIEEDLGSDAHGDRFEVTFEGGAPGTQLMQVRISGDQNQPGFNMGDVFYDVPQTTQTQHPDGINLGADESFPFQVQTDSSMPDYGIAITSVTVIDGTTDLLIGFSGFDPGEKFVFTIDVDEVEEFDRNETDIDIINHGFDPLTSGAEFDGSQLFATFSAPHYEDALIQAEFENWYDTLLAPTPLDLPKDDFLGQRDRSAAAVGSLEQSIIPAEISGYVYHDRDRDGQMDAGEEGIGETILQIIPINSVEPQETVTATTNSDGSYSVKNLKPGLYRIVELQPEGWLDGIDTPGTVDGQPQGTAKEPDTIDEIFLAGGSQGIQYNFGEYLPASLRGHVHLATADNDCFSEDVYHEPVAGVLIQLLDQFGTIVATTETNQLGEYEFVGIEPGTYSVVETTPAHLLEGGAQAGSLGGTVDGPNRIESVVLGSGQDGINYDFCEMEPVSITGIVVLSTPDGDCFSEDVEHEVVVGATVQLLDETGQLIAETVTGQDGRYKFMDLPPGTYSVVEFTPPGLIDGGAQRGSVDGTFVGDVINSGLIENITLGSGQHAIDYDFCEHLPATISGYVYHDRNDDGSRHGESEYIANVQLQLIDVAGTVVQTATTNADGFYQFTEVELGEYSIVEVQPNGWWDGKDAAGTIAGQVVGQAD
ncbi:MAG: carboxypeptidase regulatory-like domain-containing protein, partial [Planctomycetales bacterium]|nr:carboxypeptidase regulatory-like domain-containing protein [Planctomycetales bacterium]